MNKKIIFGIAGALFLLLSVAAMDYLGFFEEEVVAEEEEVVVELGDAYYVPLPRPFIFNLSTANRTHMVQIKAQLLVRGGNNEQLALDNIPLIEDTMLTTFSSANFDALLTQAGKDSLRQDTLLAVQDALQKVTGKTVVEQMLFTGFVMQ
jgi:flagellar protein FliL